MRISKALCGVGRLLGLLILLAISVLSGCSQPLKPDASQIDLGLNEEIAYLRLSDGRWQVWLMDRDGRQHRQLTHDTVDKVRLSWSVARQQLFATRSDGKVMAISLDGQTDFLELSLGQVYDAQISPNGQWLLVSINATQVMDNNDLWLVRPDGRDARKLAQEVGVSQLASWSPDGQHLVYCMGRGVRNAHQIWLMDVNSGVKEQLTVGKALRFDPSYLGSQAIVFSEKTQHSYNIWYQSLAGQRQQLTHHSAFDAQPVVSPDGQTLVFYSHRGQQKRLWSKPLELLEQSLAAEQSIAAAKALTPASVYSRQPVWLRSKP